MYEHYSNVIGQNSRPKDIFTNRERFLHSVQRLKDESDVHNVLCKLLLEDNDF